MSTIDQAIAQMRAHGMPELPLGHPVADGKFHRFGPKKRGWYVAREIQLRSGRVVLTGAFGEFGHVEKTLFEIDWEGLSEQDRIEAQRKREELERAEVEKRRVQAEKAANRAKQQWDSARASGSSPYLKRKGVEAEKGMRFFSDGTLLVPMIDYGPADPVLVGLQKIAPDGTKRFNKGVAKEGSACRFGKPFPGAPILIAEGVATALSIREALGRSVPVFVAFDCGNLKPVAQRVRAKYPDSTIVLCADDDWRTEGNPGRHHAQAAAEVVGNARVVWPCWTDGEPRDPGWTDFNDLHASRGLQVVREQFAQVLALAREGISTPSSASASRSPLPPLLRDAKSRIIDCRENVYRILTTESAWEGVIAFDEFANRIVKRKPPPWGGPAGEWTETDDIRVGVWFVDELRFVVRSMENIRAAVMLAADDAKFHPVKVFLEGLKWDGTARADMWMVDCLGVVDSEYARRVGRYSLLNMIARVFEPGCIMRAVPVLEGPQERGKSTALAILGGEWFSDTPFRVGEKDAALQISGTWVYEIGEMQQFNRAEAAAVKQFVSSRVDNYRPPYGRRNVHVPRQTTFWGSINEQQYLRDWTGGTRFWPVRTCETGEIEPARLADMREQLLAEAVALFRKGERRHPTREESETLFAPEQERRMQEVPWEAHILDELDRRTQTQITVDEVLVDIVKVERGRITPAQMAEVGRILTRGGWIQERPRGPGGVRKRVYSRPKAAGQAKAGEGDDGLDAPF